MAVLTESLALFGHIQRIAAVSSAPEDSAYPAANLLLPRLSDQWRSPLGSLTNVTLQFSLGGSQSDLEHVVLHGVNLGLSATRRVRVATALTAFSGGAGTVTADSGTGLAFDNSQPELVDSSPPWGRTLLWFPPATVSGAYVEIVLTDAGNPANQLIASNVNAGPVWQPERTFGRDWKLPDSFAGQPGLEKVLRGHKLSLPRLTPSEARELVSLFRALRRTGRIYVAPRPQSPETWLDEVIYATASDYDRSTVAQLAERRQINVTFAEVDD